MNGGWCGVCLGKKLHWLWCNRHRAADSSRHGGNRQMLLQYMFGKSWLGRGAAGCWCVERHACWMGRLLCACWYRLPATCICTQLLRWAMQTLYRHCRYNTVCLLHCWCRCHRGWVCAPADPEQDRWQAGGGAFACACRLPPPHASQLTRRRLRPRSGQPAAHRGPRGQRGLPALPG
jgi:hypothetical protein